MKNYWTQSSKNIFVAAHRGWSSNYPENTMEAFRAAVELGVDQIEMDIRVTKDNELVVFHDETVDRVTNGTGKVCDLTLAELKALDAGIKKGEQFKGAKIPTFVEFLEYMKTLPDMTIDFELKEYPKEGWEDVSYSVCDRILALIDEYGMTERCVVNTFSQKLHDYIQTKHPGKYRHHVFYPYNCMVDKTDSDIYAYAYCACVFDQDKARFDEMRQRGVHPWAGASVKDAATVDWAIEMGVELITCNNPDVVMDLLRQRGYHK